MEAEFSPVVKQEHAIASEVKPKSKAKDGPMRVTWVEYNKQAVQMTP